MKLLVLMTCLLAGCSSINTHQEPTTGALCWPGEYHSCACGPNESEEKNNRTGLVTCGSNFAFGPCECPDAGAVTD